MTQDALQRCDAELSPLLAAEGAPAAAREHAEAFNADVATVRAALLEPARDLARRGTPLRDLAACLEKAVAELAFWRRVLKGVHGTALGPEPGRPDYLLRWISG